MLLGDDVMDHKSFSCTHLHILKIGVKLPSRTGDMLFKSNIYLTPCSTPGPEIINHFHAQLN